MEWPDIPGSYNFIQKVIDVSIIDKPEWLLTEKSLSRITSLGKKMRLNPRFPSDFERRQIKYYSSTIAHVSILAKRDAKDSQEFLWFPEKFEKKVIRITQSENQTKSQLIAPRVNKK